MNHLVHNSYLFLLCNQILSTSASMRLKAHHRRLVDLEPFSSPALITPRRLVEALRFEEVLLAQSEHKTSSAYATREYLVFTHKKGGMRVGEPTLQNAINHGEPTPQNVINYGEPTLQNVINHGEPTLQNAINHGEPTLQNKINHGKPTLQNKINLGEVVKC